VGQKSCGKCQDRISNRATTQKVVASTIQSSKDSEMSKNILYVDDNVVMLDLIKLLL